MTRRPHPAGGQNTSRPKRMEACHQRMVFSGFDPSYSCNAIKSAACEEDEKSSSDHHLVWSRWQAELDALFLV